MKQRFTENQILLVKKGVSLVAVFAVLIVSLVAVAPDMSFGWFSQNADVTASGMEVKAEKTDFDVFYRMKGAAEWIAIDLSSPIAVADTLKSPGITATFEIKIVNKGRNTVTLKSFGIAPPVAGVEEKANAAGVCLSTELYTTIKSVKTGNGSKTHALSTPPVLDDTGVSLSTTEAIDYIQYVKSSDPISLSPNGDAVFEISIMFLNRTESQNQFKNFGVNSDGICSRRLFFTYDEQ
jgi:hypothetical protein